MASLQGRLLLAATVVLTAFLGLTGAVLDGAFRDAARRSLEERLQAYVYGLLAAADLAEDGSLKLPDTLPNARFSSPGSGLYAAVTGAGGRDVWHSPSLLGMGVAFPAGLAPGSWRLEELRARDGDPLYAASFGVAWETPQGEARDFTFTVAEGLESYQAQVGGFRRSLWGWLLAAALVLVAVQGSILRWGLAPLRQAEQELRNLEAGRTSRLRGRYPRELQGFTDALNAFIHQEREHLERYRRALADLAHSLKTPLAVLRGYTRDQSPPETLRVGVQEQVDRMSAIVDYQLHRAAAAGASTLATPIPIEGPARRVLSSLEKVYRDKDIACGTRFEGGPSFRGEQGDLLEVLGNLLDNAYKWARQQVRLSARPLPGDALAARPGLLLVVEDDGPGIAEQAREHVLRRGGRADPGTEGHGIGLAVVREIAAAYGGELLIERSELGGARVSVRFPAL